MNEYPPCDHPYDGWFVDDVPLDSQGFLVASFVDAAPARRGENLTIARAPGARWRQKYYQQRRQQIVVWALKDDRFGNVLGGGERNVDRLKRLFGGGLKQVELTRRLTLPFERVSTRTALVELVDAMEGRRTALTQTGVYTQFALDLEFADPFWYEPVNVATVDGSAVLWNPGTVTSRNPVVRIFGPAVEPTITWEPAGTTLTYDGTIDYGDWVEIDGQEFTAVTDAGVSVAGNLDRAQVELFEIAPGRNEVTLSDGTADISWRPAFL